MNLGMLMYKGYYYPLAWPLAQKVDMFNEIIINVTTMHLIFFTDWVPDYEVQFAYGWSMIIVMSLNMFVNTLIIFWFGGKALKQVAIKTYYKIKQWLPCKKKEKVPSEPVDCDETFIGKMPTGMFDIQEMSNESESRQSICRLDTNPLTAPIKL